MFAASGSVPAVSATCVRVPVLRAHSEALSLTFADNVGLTRAQATEVLSKAPGIKIVDDWATNTFPTPLDASGGDDVLVGRIRPRHGVTAGLELFVCGDQIRKGAALNAVQIAELLVDGNAVAGKVVVVFVCVWGGVRGGCAIDFLVFAFFFVWGSLHCRSSPASLPDRRSPRCASGSGIDRRQHTAARGGS